jgi:hypothetical protein
MFLTREEEAMLNGEYGEGPRIAMSVLAKLGDLYHADRMIKVENVHIDGAAYGWISDAGLDFVERFCNSGVAFKVPTTLNPSSIDFHAWKEYGTPACIVKKQFKLAEAFKKMGAIPTWTCAPYQSGANLRYGQNVAWGESNAVGFANTVVGARSEKLGDLADICAAVVGAYPRFGLYLDENRQGQILFELKNLDTRFFTSTDYGILGFYIGTIAKTRVPVVTGISKNATSDQLKAFCTGAAVGGSVSLTHICGVTPEAPTIAQANSRMQFEEKISVGIEELEATKAKLNTTQGKHPEVICIGCPHCSVEELINIARMLKGKKVVKSVKLLVFTSRMAKALASDMGIIGVIEAAGGKVIADTCYNFVPLKEKILLTDSVKMAWTCMSKFSDVMLESTNNCIKVAIREETEDDQI